MQNKGLVTVFAVLLTLVCCFYLSFSFVTRHYENKANEFANGDFNAKTHYLDSLSSSNVWLGYTLKECREKEIALGLDLKGGMNVILEVDAASVIRSLANTDDKQFNDALKQAIDINYRGSNKDFVSLFVEQYEKIDKSAKLANIFSITMKDRVKPADSNSDVAKVLAVEVKGVSDNSFNVLRTRIDRFGVAAPTIQKLERAEQISVELPGITEPERVRNLLQGSANLEFWRTFNQQTDPIVNVAVNELDQKTLAYLTVAKTDTAKVAVTDSVATDSTAIAEIANTVATIEDGSIEGRTFKKRFSEYFTKPGYGAILGYVHRNDTAEVNTILAKYKDSYPRDLKFMWAFKALKPGAYGPEVAIKADTEFALFTLRGDGTKKGPALDGDAIVASKADQVNNGWGVSMQMNSTGSKKWATITGAEKGKQIAIILDGYVYSAPNVNDQITGGNSSITGDFTKIEADDLENVLKSGKLKAGIRIVQEDVVGPSLGAEAIQAGLISFIIALFVLMAYMCLVYGFIPGMIANGALLLNLFFTLGILASFHAVLTLPGICGLLLALAMAVDANVLIYERTKEELKAGKNVKQAVRDGYKHAFSAIFDSNLTSIITGAILYMFGTGVIRGFAITEIIGILASFFTAIFMTRMVYEYGFSKGKFYNLTFATKPFQNLLMDTKINFLKMHRKAYAISLIVIVLGIVSLFTLKLNTGIDFTGGRNYIVRFENPVNTQEVTQKLRPAFGEDYTVSAITIGSSNQVRISTNYKYEEMTDAVDAEIKGIMTSSLKDYMKEGDNIDQYIQSSQVVGPSVADDMARAAVVAVVIAIICMGLYILLRFRDVAFSISTIIAVAHDAAIVVFAYSFFHKFMPFSLEIDQHFIAAILTVIGFSIHDKVVIFDRVRERRRDFSTRSISQNINDSLNTTLTRTLSTTISTVLVLLCVLFLGGDSIRSFAFAMLIGIILAVYSSVFIATPIAYEILEKKEKKKKGEVDNK